MYLPGGHASLKMTESFGKENEIRTSIKTLSRGLMHADYSVAFRGYKSLYEQGIHAIPPLRDIILGIDWSNSKYKELARYVAGVFSLIHDIDESEANRICSTVATNGCPQYIQSLFQSTCSFSTEHFLRYKVCGVEIFEHGKIQKKCEIKKHIEHWLKSIPAGDLSEISRLYIVPREEIDTNAAGTYTPGLFKIVLLWDNNFKENSLPFKMLSLLTEQTLYHEIGHHMHRHTFHQHTADKEKEADGYASKIMRENHCILCIIAKLLHKIGYKNQRNYYRWGL
ncbi:MAG: hypothetical protein ACYDBT_15515 [Desulfobulbaceae bacterium]